MSCNSLPSATTTLSEAEFEQIALDWLHGLGCTVKQGLDIAPKMPTTDRSGLFVLEQRLRRALAHRILILHAAQGSKTEALATRPSPPPSPSTPSPSPHNAHLMTLGAQPHPPRRPIRPPARLNRPALHPPSPYDKAAQSQFASNHS